VSTLGKVENQNAADGSLVGVGAAPAHYERYGRYFLVERIGRGGMAEVFRAVAQGVEGFRRVFVIKRIRPEKSTSAELVRMFCDEARLSALLHHPNIVQVYDFGQISGTHFLAMEYLHGKDLAAVMRVIRRANSALGPSIAAYVAHQVATGLHYAHTLTRMDGQPMRVVHRDVTPSNIMLLRAGGVKVLDFGIAQATNFARQVETGGGRVKGKLAYLSPEQVRLQELDGRSDLFALGVVLWETLVGQRLFPGETDFLTMRNVLSQPVPAPSSIRPEVPAALDAIVARALERDRGARYPTAQAMADDLERFLQEAPCHSQAVPRLLHELFGEEATDQTPELPLPSLPPELPPDALAEIDAGVAGASAPPPPSADAQPATGGVPTAYRSDGPSVQIEVLPDEAVASASSLPAPTGAPLDPSRSRRRVVVAAATATLAGCLLWAVWRGKPIGPHDAGLAPGRTIVTQAPPAPERVVSPAQPAPAPPPAAAPAERAEEAEADTDGDTEPAADTKTAAERGKSPRKHASHRISNDVTLDPFK